MPILFIQQKTGGTELKKVGMSTLITTLRTTLNTNLGHAIQTERQIERKNNLSNFNTVPVGMAIASTPQKN